MSDIKPLPEFISYKKLKSFLSNAPKERKRLETEKISGNYSKEALDEHLKSWLESSEILIKHLHSDSIYIAKNNSKPILALGAMEAHINMAIQALKAFKSESE